LGKKWSLNNVIAVDCETSVIYVLASLLKLPVINILTVSDHVVREEPKNMNEQTKDRIRKTFDLALKAAYETIFEFEKRVK